MDGQNIRKILESGSILDNVGAGLCLMDRDMHIAWANKRFIEIYGSEKDIIGKLCYEIYKYRDSICENCPHSKIFQTGSPKQFVQQVLNSKRQQRFYQFTLTPVRDGHRKITHILELVEDVTEKKLAEEKLKAKTSQFLHIAREVKILNIELEERVRQRTHSLEELNKELAKILEVNNVITSTLDMEEVLNQIVRTACILMGAHACSLRLLEPKSRALIAGASFGLKKNFLLKTPLTVGEGIPGLIAKTKQPLIITDTQKDKRVKYPERLHNEGMRSILGVPILFKDDVAGTLLVYSIINRDFSPDEVRLLSIFASQAAIAIENARSHNELESSYFDTIETLALAIEYREPHLRGHSDKVTSYSIMMGEKFNLANGDIQTIRYAGRLHDIGKIAISDAILQKPGRLTPQERAEIEKHPSKGAEMLAPLRFLRNAIPIIKHHHERYDGKGYPDGLKGNFIPFISRIICVADAFDAMTSERPYRKKIDDEDALRELCNNSGNQFDPKIVTVFEEILGKT